MNGSDLGYSITYSEREFKIGVSSFYHSQENKHVSVVGYTYLESQMSVHQLPRKSDTDINFLLLTIAQN